MKLSATVGNESIQVEVRREGERVFARVDDREYELEVSAPETNVYLMRHEGRVHEFFVAPNTQGIEMSRVSSGTATFEVSITDPKRLRGSAIAGASTDGVAELRTAMPGKVVRIIMDVGANVDSGDAVMVVEAMKMQNDLKAPRPGVIKEIRVVEGQTVSAGDVLAVIG